MARASTRACMSVVLTAALGGASLAWASPATVGLSAALAQTKPSRLSSALYSGIECYRRGEYDQAATYFQQAQAGRDSLPAETRQELDRYVKLNSDALKARAEGAAQLRQAEIALKAGRSEEAAALLKLLTTNPFLSPEDHQQAIKLNDKVRPQNSDDPGRTLEARAKLRQGRELLGKWNFGAAETLAREVTLMKGIAPWQSGEDTPLKLLDDIVRLKNDAKYLLQGARNALARQDYDEAEKLAHMAEKAQGIVPKIVPMPFRDSPSKVLKDTASARRGIPVKSDATTVPVVTPASAPKEPAKVETFKKSIFNWMTPGSKDPKSDSVPDGSVGQAAPAPAPASDKKPATAASDVPNAAMPVGAVAMAPKPAAPTTKPAAAATPATPGSKRTSIPDDEAHKLLKETRKAMAENRLDDARKLLARVRETKTTYTWGELWWDPDAPDKVDSDLRRAEAKRTSSSAVAKVAEPKVDPKHPMTRDEARAQLKKTRDLMKTGKLDEADKLACQVRETAPKGCWGLFDDSPDKVVLDLRKMKARRDREESERLLAQARKDLQEGRFEEARAKAAHAEELHGPYNVWEFGDRPQRLIGEIALAEGKTRRNKPATPATPKEETVVARAPEPKTGGPTPTDHMPPLSPPGAVTDAQALEARRLLADARAAVRDNNLDQATRLATQVQTMNVAQDRLGNDTPDAVLQDIMRLRGGEPSAATAVVSLPPKPPANDPITLRARELLAEARRFQAEGKLVEARAKALEAQKYAANFQADEDRPERALLELAGLAQKRIENLLTAANEAACAEESLGQARQLAVGFALDTQPIDARLSVIHAPPIPEAVASQTPVSIPPNRAANPTAIAVPPVPPGAGAEEASAVPVAPDQQGLRLLDQARVEITKGNTASARKMAEEALKGPYGEPVQAQAQFVLRSIDAEEQVQRRNQANRSFDAALSAYNRGDATQTRGILAAIDITLLDRDKANRYKEIMRAPEMKPPAVAQVSDRGNEGAAHVAVSDEPAAQKSMPSGDNNFANKVAGLQEIQFQHMRDEGLRAQREATESMRRGEADRALEILNAYLEDLGRANLDQARAQMLRRGVENRAQQFGAAREQMIKATADKDRANIFKTMMSSKVNADQQKRELVASQMKQFHDLYKQGKYREAELCAAKAHELDPDSPAAGAGMAMAKMAGRREDYRELKDGKEELVLRGLNDTDDEGPHVNIHTAVKFPVDYRERMEKRGSVKDIEFNPLRTERDREIERRLNHPISFQFENKPLRKVLEEIGDLTGINVVPDVRALNEKGISLDLPMSQKLEGIALKSALTIVLDQAHLTYVIKNEVLMVTTPDKARGGMQSKTYQVADLVVPIDNYTVGGNADLANVTAKMMQTKSGFATSFNTPYTGPMSLPSGTNVGQVADGTVSPGATMSGSVNAPGPVRSPLPTPGAMSAKAGRVPGQTMEDVLINLITNTIAPDKWQQMGGAGTIDYFPLGMALVVNQTPDIQEQIAELLSALRRLQDVEVAIEVRFITISESFYERIGVDFNMNVLSKISPGNQTQITTGVFAPATQVNSPRFDAVSGLTPAGTFTHDLNIPITNSSFGPAVPLFGGFPIAPGADGGLSLGLAFLSDIQVFLFLEAAQGDRRTNVMQAPKLTMFNAQTATINVQDTVFFVTGNIIGLFNGQTTYSPQNQPFNIGLQLTMQPVVSADRRFVRVSLAPTLTNLTTPLAALFPFTTVITPTFDTGVAGQPIPITQYLQQPNFTTVGVQTTVSVPDGGTVLLGGLKTLREGRNEFGPPVLSKLPYVNRLFKNTAYGRDAESLMLMVTPRIIINEEEEERATGLRNGVAP